MLRLACILIALYSAAAAQLTEAVNCGGNRSSVALTLPPPNLLPDGIGCTFQSLEAQALARELVFTAAAIDNNPFPDPRLQRGGLSANVDFEGQFSMVFFSPVIPAYWSACITSPVVDRGGTGYATGFYGSYAIGSPCDFAHALPVLPENIIPVIFDLSAQNGYVAQVLINWQFFDAAGNLSFNGVSLHYELIPGDVPEPPSSILLLVPLIAASMWGRIHSATRLQPGPASDARLYPSPRQQLHLKQRDHQRRCTQKRPERQLVLRRLLPR